MSDPSSVSNDFDFNHIITSQISRVEILKGNQSSRLWKRSYRRNNKYYN